MSLFMLLGVRYGLKNKAVGISEQVLALDAARDGGCQAGLQRHGQ